MIQTLKKIWMLNKHDWVGRFRLVRLLKVVAGIYLGYVLFAYFAVNPIAKALLPWIAEHKLASRISVEQVKFNPFNLLLTVDQLKLTKPDGSPLASFDHLLLNIQTTGIFRFAWRLKDVQLISPEVVLDIAPDGKLNWADLIAKLNEDKKPDDSGMARLVIDHILIDGGDVQYTDRNRPTPFKAVLAPLGLELEGLSTLPEDRGDYLISASLPEQGGHLKWKGDLSLNPIASKGSVEIEGIHLAKLMQVLKQQTLPFEITGGDLQSSLDYRFAMVKVPANQTSLAETDPAKPSPVKQGSTQPELPPVPEAHIEKLTIKLSNLAANLQGNAHIALAETNILLPALDFSMRNGTQLKFAGLNIATNDWALTQGKDSLLKLHQATVNDVGFDLTEQQLKVGEISLDAGEVHAKRLQDGSINWQQLIPESKQQASVSDTTIESNHAKAGNKATEDIKPFKFELANLKLAHWSAAFEDQSFVHVLTANIQDINLNLSANNTNGAPTIAPIGAELSGISLQSALSSQALAYVDKLSLQSGVVNLNDSSVKLSEILISGLQTQVLRAADQSINWQTALATIATNPSTGVAKLNVNQANIEQAKTSAWKVSLDKLALQNSGVHIEDKSTPSPVVFDIENALFELDNTSVDLAKPLPFIAKLQFKQGGQFDAKGQLALQPLKADLQIKLDALSLKPFSPYINQAAYLKLSDGQANLQGRLAVGVNKNINKTLSAQFTGGFSIKKLAINEEPDDVLFLGWSSLSSSSLKLGISPNQLHMDELRIEQPTGKFIIYEDKTLNVKRILRAPEMATKTSPADPKPSAAASSSGEAFPISIDRVSVDSANLEFADLSLKPQFGTHINSLSGVINHLSTNPSTTAQVEMDGKVDEFGSARIRGSIQPFRATDFTDLKLSFHNLEMNRLTPYSGKFAGRRIDSGKISVDLEYKIKQRQLTGENKFVINKLRLGEHVDSPDAINLPLDLAIALLEDSDGVIDLDLPISGSLDDPQFSYGKIMWKAILNVFEKIVTSPFRLLGNLLGVSSDKLEAISFDPGSAALLPEEQEKLKSVADGMAKRSTLTLSIVPAFDAAADQVALQDLTTRRDVLNDMGIKLKDGEQPGPLDLNNVKVQSAIENMLKERSGEGRNLKALQSLKDYFKKSKPEEVPKYADMLQQLRLTANVTDADLTALAKARAAAAQDYLLNNAGLAAEKLTIAEPVKVVGDGKTVNLKMNLGATKK